MEKINAKRNDINSFVWISGNTWIISTEICLQFDDLKKYYFKKDIHLPLPVVSSECREILVHELFLSTGEKEIMIIFFQFFVC